MDSVPDPFQARLSRALGDGYRVVRELGGGGMSRVFLAADVSLGRNVVFKVLPPELAADVNRERFRREVQLAAGLQHPMIVPLHSAGEADGLIWYSMPFVDGDSLRERLKAGALSTDDALPILVDVARALAAAHRRGVVHRDIKPGNILLQDKHALVADFGIAKALRVSVAESNASLGLTGTGFAVGTPTYMAPEQAAGDETVDARADIYALGCVAYEMLSGRTPFVEASAPRMLIAHATHTPAPLESVALVTASMSAVIMRCLEKEPAQRWETADQLADALERQRFNEPATQVASAPTIIAELPTKSEDVVGSARSPRVSRMAALLGGAVVASAAVALVAMSGARHEAREASAFVAPRTILIADAENRTADSTLGDLLTESLRTELLQSPAVTVMSERAVAAVLARMQRTAETSVTAAVAREIAIRDGVPGVVEASIRKVGTTYLLRASLVASGTGAEQFSLQERAVTDDSLISAVGRLARRTRESLGESRAALQSLAPMSQVTTSSLEALRSYSKARRLRYEARMWGTADGQRNVELLEAAVRIDSNFATAWRLLGVTLLDDGAPPTARSDFALRRAYALRDRLSPVERAIAEASYFAFVQYDRKRATTSLVSILSEQPGNIDVLAFLAYLTRDDGNFERQREYAARRVALDSTNIEAWKQLAASNFASGRGAEGRSILGAMRRRFTSAVDAMYIDLQYLFFMSLERDWDEVEVVSRKLLALRLDRIEFDYVLDILHDACANRGQLEKAWRVSDSMRAMRLAGSDSANRRIYRGQSARQRYVDRALYGGDTSGIREKIRRYVAESGMERWSMNEREDVNENLWFDYLLAGERRRARASLAAFNDPTFETIPALLLYLDGRYRESLPALLKRAPPELPYAVYETFYIGTVYLELAKPDSAREWFEKVTAVSHDIRRSIFLDGRTRHPALRRLCELADTPVRKQQSCGAIVEEWKDADPFLQPIVARAKARLAE